MDRYSVTRLPVERIDDAIALVDAGLGTDEKHRTELETLTTFCVIQPSGELLGLCTTEIVTNADELSKAMPGLNQERVAEVAALLNYPAGYLHTGVVDERFRKAGVGTAILNHINCEWASVPVRSQFASAWERSDTGVAPAASVLTAGGLQQMLRIPNYWTEDSQARGYPCPSCPGICECAALVFVRRF